MATIIGEGITFDDVLLVPQYSEVTPNLIDLRTNLTKKIPIVISSVTDPESAKLVKSNKNPGTNVTGTSDLTPCAAQMELVTKLFPNAKTVGMLYCSSEQNSLFQVKLAEEACDKLGLKYVLTTAPPS